MATDSILQSLAALCSISNGIFLLFGLSGMLAHAIKKYYSNELSGSIFNYFFKNNQKRTILAIITTIGALLGVILGGQVPAQAGAFVMLAFMTGFSADSTVNKDGSSNT